MSASEKVSHVRFRDDADLVEFEGCSKVRTEELHSTSTSHKTEISVAINGLEITKKKPEEDEIKLKYFSAFQTINRVHGGAIMKIKVGVAGSTPAKDSFPMFGATKKWACLHWDADTAPSHWCVAYYPEPPEWFDSALQSVVSSATASESPKHSISEKVNNFSSTDDLIDTLASSTKSSSNLNFSGNGPSLIQSSLFPLPDVNTALKVIRLQEISDLYLEVAPAVAFRLYCGKEVIHFTPVNAYNVLSKRSACWADSIYSALALLQEPDMELVQLYKQEFVSLLQQHAADRQFRSDSSNSVGDGSGESLSGGDAQGSQPAPRPLMRRRSTLSSFLGISASKPLKYSAFKDIDTGADLGGESENEASESPTAHTKKSFFSAVNKVRKLLGTRKDSFTRSKGTLHFQPDNSASGSFGDDDTAVDRKKEGEGKTGLTDNDKANRHQQQQQQQLSSRTRGDSSDESGSSKRGGAEKTSTGYSPQPGSANFLSQSLLRMHSGQSPRSPAERSTSFNSSACASVSASGTAVVNDSASELQAQVEQLLQQNRLLQQQLNNSGNSTPLPISFDNIEQTPRIAAAVQIDKPAPPPVTYTTNELTTLRAFTARTNYHQNKNAHKNAARAFSGNGDNSASNNSKKSDLQKVRNLSPSSNKVKAESSSQPVLGKVTVLDRLLSQQQQTQAYITKNAAEDAPAYEGDDYYNDTIELDPLSVVQLIELHKLHQLELLKEREREKGEGCDGGGGAAGEGSGAEEAAVPSPQSRQRRRRESAALQQGKRNAQSEVPQPKQTRTMHDFLNESSGGLAMEDPDSVPASSVTVVAESDNSTSVRHHHQATLNSVWKGPPASRQPASLGSGIQQSHVPSMVHSPILKQPSLRVSLEAGATGDMGGGGGGAGVSSSTSTRTKKSVSIVEHQLQATKQRELRLLNLLTNTSGSDTSFSPSATASTSVANSAPAISKARSDSADLEHKSSDGGEHGRNHGARSDTSSSSKGQLWNENHTHISNTALGRNSKSAAAAWTSSRSKGEELAQSDASAGQPRPPFSTEEENERLTSATASVDSPHRFAKEGAAAATALQQHRQESVRGAAKVAKVGSGLLAAVNGVVPQPRLSSGTIESERLSDSQLSATSNGKIVQKVRTVNKDEKVRTPTKVGKSSSLLSQEAEKIAKNALTTHREVSDRSERAENVTHVGSLNMRPLAYDSDPEVGKETDVTLTDIESLKTPQWSNNYFYADNNSRKGAKKVRKSRLLTERGGQNSYVSDFGADNKFNKITWAAFVAGVPPAHTVNAMCVEGMVICFLLTHRELQLAMEVCKMCLYCADSKRGILEFSPHQQEQENHKFQPGDEGSCLVLVHPVAEEFVFVPLVDMVSAELDTNNTGLFKLTMNLLSAVSTSTSATTATPRWCGNGNGTGKSNSLVACLAGQLLKSPTVPSVPRPSQGGVPSNDKASPVEFQELRSVSLVLKASETLQLVEWLTALMELRG